MRRHTLLLIGCLLFLTGQDYGSAMPRVTGQFHTSVRENDFFYEWIFTDSNISGSKIISICKRDLHHADVSPNESNACYITDKVTITGHALVINTPATITGDCHFTFACDAVDAGWSTIKVGVGEAGITGCDASTDDGGGDIDVAGDACTQRNHPGTTCDSGSSMFINIDDGSDNCDVVQGAYIRLYGKWSRSG